jgi:hypothetical protein
VTLMRAKCPMCYAAKGALNVPDDVKVWIV